MIVNEFFEVRKTFGVHALIRMKSDIPEILYSLAKLLDFEVIQICGIEFSIDVILITVNIEDESIEDLEKICLSITSEYLNNKKR